MLFRCISQELPYERQQLRRINKQGEIYRDGVSKGGTGTAKPS
jgi:hypothetical protein